MTSRFGTSLAGNSERTCRTLKDCGGLPSMSAKQLQAYLTARDLARRIRRTESLDPTPMGRLLHLGDRAQSTPQRDRGVPSGLDRAETGTHRC